MFRRKKKTRVEKAREDIEKQIRVVNKQAQKTRKEFIKGLNTTAEELRSGISTMLSREEQKQANRIAQELESIAKNVEKRAEKGLGEVTESAQENVWGTVAFAFVLGLIVGMIIKNILD